MQNFSFPNLGLSINPKGKYNLARTDPLILLSKRCGGILTAFLHIAHGSPVTCVQPAVWGEGGAVCGPDEPAHPPHPHHLLHRLAPAQDRHRVGTWCPKVNRIPSCCTWDVHDDISFSVVDAK